MPTSPGPQALEAPSVSLSGIAPSLFLVYADWSSRTWASLALLLALLLLLRLGVHVPSRFAGTTDYLGTILGITKSPTSNGFRSAGRAPDQDKLKLFAVRRAAYASFRDSR